MKSFYLCLKTRPLPSLTDRVNFGSWDEVFLVACVHFIGPILRLYPTRSSAKLINHLTHPLPLFLADT